MRKKCDDGLEVGAGLVEEDQRDQQLHQAQGRLREEVDVGWDVGWM